MVSPVSECLNERDWLRRCAAGVAGYSGIRQQHMRMPGLFAILRAVMSFPSSESLWPCLQFEVEVRGGHEIAVAIGVGRTVDVRAAWS